MKQAKRERAKSTAVLASGASTPTAAPLPANVGSRFQRNFTQLRFGDDDPIHGGASAEEKYRVPKIAVDPDRMRIDAVPDFNPKFMKANRTVNVTVKDPDAKWIEWQLIDPEGRSLGVFETRPGDADATSRPFELKKDFFPEGFPAGQYVLRCTAYNAKDDRYLRADRDFYVLADDPRNARVSHGSMYFSEYVALFGKSQIDPPYQYQVRVKLAFMPDTDVACNDIAMMQTVQVLQPDGEVANKASYASRTTQAQWRIDYKNADLTPYYITRTNSAGKPEDVRPEEGYGQKGWGGANRREASSKDDPAGFDPQVWRYETCAVCRSGADIGQVFGCATWGFSTDKDDNAELMPASFSSWPTEEFVEATKKWNLWAAKAPERVPAPEFKR